MQWPMISYPTWYLHCTSTLCSDLWIPTLHGSYTLCSDLFLLTSQGNSTLCSDTIMYFTGYLHSMQWYMVPYLTWYFHSKQWSIIIYLLELFTLHAHLIKPHKNTCNFHNTKALFPYSDMPPKSKDSTQRNKSTKNDPPRRPTQSCGAPARFGE